MYNEMTQEIREDIEQIMKIFLSEYHDFDFQMRNYESRKSKTNDETPGWISSYKFLSLPNILQAIDDYGPLKNLWEGKMLGEKFLIQTKDEFNGWKRHWSRYLLDNINTSISIDRIYKNRIKHNMENNLRYLERGKVFSYANVDSIKESIREKEPISIIQLNDGYFGCIHGCYKKLTKITPMNFVSNNNSLCYFIWQLEENCDTENIIQHEIIVQKYCILLPFTPTETMNISTYALVTAEWEIMNESKRIALPSYSPID